METIDKPTHKQIMAMPKKQFRAVVWYDGDKDVHNLTLHAEVSESPQGNYSRSFVGEIVWRERNELDSCKPALVFDRRTEFRGTEGRPLQELADSLWRTGIKPSKHVCNYEETIAVLKEELKVKNDQIAFLQAQNILMMEQLARPIVMGTPPEINLDHLKPGDITVGLPKANDRSVSGLVNDWDLMVLTGHTREELDAMGAEKVQEAEDLVQKWKSFRGLHGTPTLLTSLEYHKLPQEIKDQGHY